MKKTNLRSLGLCVPMAALAALNPALPSAIAEPGWVTGDFHQHTLHTDGSYVMAEVFGMENQYGLDWWANSEHGGKQGDFRWKDIGACVDTWKGTLGNSWSEVQAGRAAYPDKVIIQGLEWNVPGHEHCSMGCIANQFSAEDPNAAPVAEFEYRFDAGDSDSSGGPGGIWTDKNFVNDHAKAVQAAAWLGANYPTTSWLVPAHPERYVYNGKTGYEIGHFRDLNNAAPSVFFGFESMPGHQRSSQRGEYNASRPSVGEYTYGGCGAFSASVGGLWDALLGEGRHFWLFANSDFHGMSSDYWPGQYQKNHTYVAEKSSPQAIVDGMRSGRTFVTEGDLVDSFEFAAAHANQIAVMGEDLELTQGGVGNPQGNPEMKVTLYLEFSSPAANNAPAPLSNTPRVDHIDIIGGQITGVVSPDSANYNEPTNRTTQVIARFYNPDSGLRPAWSVDPVSGKNTVQLSTRVAQNTYFRVRGTNNRIGVDTLDIDVSGNPVRDDVNPAAGDTEAWNDLWFYSNPIFVYLDHKRPSPHGAEQ